MKKYFKICSTNYDENKLFYVYRPASLNNPKNNSVMFIVEKMINLYEKIKDVKECIIFWPKSIQVPQKLEENNVVVQCINPHLEYCKFFDKNKISNIPTNYDYNIINLSVICNGAKIGKNNIIFPFCYISNECIIGDNVYIGSGCKILGDVKIGNNVVIRENTVIGADGLSTDRDINGKAVTMPQFGGVIIEDNVQIGANVVIARGAIDNTIIKKGVKIDNQCFISHNVTIGINSFIVGETILFGSSSVGNNCLISGNSTLGNYVHIGDNSIVGVGSNVLKSIEQNKICYGSPAKVIKENGK